MTEKHVQNIDLNEVITTLEKNPLERNPRELDRIRKQTQEISFFKKYINEGHKDVHEKCCKYMKIEHFENTNPVFFIDTVGTKFYLILRGKVGVYIRLPSSKDESQTDDAQSQPPPLTCVKELHAGEAFGELALLNNKPRLASIIAHDTLDVAVLDKKDFMIILKEKEEQKLLREMGFFARLPFFDGWNFNLVKLLYLNVFRVKYNKKDFVFQEGQEPLAVFIVTDGQFDIEKTFEKEDKLRSWQNPNEKELDQLRISNKKTSVILKLTSFVSQELFGEEDIMNQQSKRTFSAVCASATGECIMIKKQDFFLRVLKEEQTGQYLRNRLISKNELFTIKTNKMKEQIHGFKNYFYKDSEKMKQEKIASLSILKNEQFSEELAERYIKKSDQMDNINHSRSSSPKKEHSPQKSTSRSPSKCLSPIASSSMILFQPQDSHSEQQILSRVLKTYQNFPSLKELSKPKSRPKTPSPSASMSVLQDPPSLSNHNTRKTPQLLGLLQDKSNNSRNPIDQSPTAVISLKIPSKMRFSLPTSQMKEGQSKILDKQPINIEKQKQTINPRKLVTRSSLSYLDESAFGDLSKYKENEGESMESVQDVEESIEISKQQNETKNNLDGNKETIGKGASPVISKKCHIFLDLKIRSPPEKTTQQTAAAGIGQQQLQPPFSIQLQSASVSEHTNLNTLEITNEPEHFNEFSMNQQQQNQQITENPQQLQNANTNMQCVEISPFSKQSMSSSSPCSSPSSHHFHFTKEGSPNRIIKLQQTQKEFYHQQQPIVSSSQLLQLRNLSLTTQPNQEDHLVSDLALTSSIRDRAATTETQFVSSSQIENIIPNDNYFHVPTQNNLEETSPLSPTNKVIMQSSPSLHPNQEQQQQLSPNKSTVYFNSILLQKCSPQASQHEKITNIKPSQLSLQRTLKEMKMIRFRKLTEQNGNNSTQQLFLPLDNVERQQQQQQQQPQQSQNLSASPTLKSRSYMKFQQSPKAAKNLDGFTLTSSSNPRRHLKSMMGQFSTSSDFSQSSSTQDELRWRQLIEKQHVSPTQRLNNILERRQEKKQQLFKVSNMTNSHHSGLLLSQPTQQTLSSSVLDNLKGQLSIGTQFSSILKQIGSSQTSSSSAAHLNLFNKTKS